MDGSFVQQLDLETDPSFVLEELAVYFLAGKPVSLHELGLDQQDGISGGLVGVGGQAERNVDDVQFLVLEDGCHEELLDLEGRFEVHGEGGQQLEYLCVVAEPALPPADEVQVHFLLEFLGAEGVPHLVYYVFEGLYYLGDGFADGLLHAQHSLYPPEHVLDGG